MCKPLKSNPMTNLMESFSESFRQGLLVGYVFVATFSIAFIVAYYLPTQIGKKWKNNKEARQIHELSHQELKQKRIIKEKQKKARQRYKLLPVEVLEKRTEINATGWSIIKMSFTKLFSATNYFSEKNTIRVGMTGIMYKATLFNGFLAVKRLYHSQLFSRRFELEIMIMGRYNHRNIVPLLGFCVEEEEERNERILVYQYMSNGRLSDWLNYTTSRRLLRWPMVVRIALGVARGLYFLHHSLHVAHVSISSDCILIGKNFEPKISSFGGAIFVNHDDLGKNNKGFEKDVYDFGALLFELIRGKKFDQIGDNFGNAAEGPAFGTITYPTNLFENPYGFYDAMDKSLDGREFDDEVSALLRVACDCVHPLPNQRPTVVEVYSKMSSIWERDGLCEDTLI